MSRHELVGIFEGEADILAATRTIREAGYNIADVYAPYALHGLDRAMGLPPSRLSRVCFFLGLLGAVAAVVFQFWTTAVDWALDVGGKPWDSLPAFVPVIFEMMVLFAGVSTVLALFGVSRLWPGKKPAAPIEGITDDRFALAVALPDETLDPAEIRHLFSECNAVEVEERHIEPRSREGGRRLLYALNGGLAAALAVALYTLWGPGPNPERPNIEVLPDMAHAARYNAFETNTIFPDSTMLLPPEGTVPRGRRPLHYAATTEEALRAGKELVNPYAATATQADLVRGAKRYAVFCRPCHGLKGAGDGIVGKRGFPPPSTLISKRVADFPDGKIFHIITYGQVSMGSYGAQIPREDRWKIILHLRQLQQQAAADSGGLQP